MTPRDPIDAAIRAHIRALAISQKDLAAATGHTPGWVSKYLGGRGHATIDDLIRILALGLEIQTLSAEERRVLKAFRRIPAEKQLDALKVFELWARQARVRRPGSPARAR